MIELQKTYFPSTISVKLPLSKSEGLRLIVAAYLVAKGRGGARMPTLWDDETANVPDDLLVMREGLDRLLRGETEIRLSSSASVARFLLALAIARGRPCRFILTDSQLSRRPMAPLFDFFRDIGVLIDVPDGHWYVDPRSLSVPRGATVDARGWESSQFVSSLIYFSLSSGQLLTILRSAFESSSRYIWLTIESLRSIGQEVRWDGEKIEVLPSGELISTFPESTIRAIPGDWTSVSYWLELLLLHREIEKLVLAPLDPDSRHPDRAILDFLSDYLEYDALGDRLAISRKSARPRALAFDLAQNPDLFPTLFATSLGLGVSAEFSGLESLAYKESDRLQACLLIARDLGWGADAFSVDGSDRLIYTGVPRETSPLQVSLNHRGDHRLAMAFGVLATALTETTMTIPSAESVTERSYPRFFSELCGLMSDERDDEEN